MNPAQEGLRSVRNMGTPDGDEMLLLRGIESATHSIRRGHAVSAHAYVTYRKLIDRAKALEEALDQRLAMEEHITEGAE